MKYVCLLVVFGLAGCEIKKEEPDGTVTTVTLSEGGTSDASSKDVPQVVSEDKVETTPSPAPKKEPCHNAPFIGAWESGYARINNLSFSRDCTMTLVQCGSVIPISDFTKNEDGKIPMTGSFTFTIEDGSRNTDCYDPGKHSCEYGVTDGYSKKVYLTCDDETYPSVYYEDF